MVAVLMVIPLCFYSGALSILSYAIYFALCWAARYLVIADVNVVLPWSMWPIVPTNLSYKSTVNVRFCSLELCECLNDTVCQEHSGL